MYEGQDRTLAAADNRQYHPTNVTSSHNRIGDDDYLAVMQNRRAPQLQQQQQRKYFARDRRCCYEPAASVMAPANDDGCCGIALMVSVLIFLLLLLFASMAYPSYYAYDDHVHAHHIDEAPDRYAWWCRRCVDTSCAVACWRN